MPFWFKRLHIINYSLLKLEFYTVLVKVASGIEHFCLVQYSPALKIPFYSDPQ